MKLKLVNDPYIATSLVFFILLIAGVFLFGWGERNFAYTLLLYFIVILGIRLDDITRQLAAANERLDRLVAGQGKIAAASSARAIPPEVAFHNDKAIDANLNRIREALEQISGQLNRIQNG